MEQIVSITSRGQLTIPKEFREVFGVHGATKAMIRREGDTFVVTPRRAFASLSGSLRSNVKLSDKQLRLARKAFAKNWSRPM